jgi:hypothetical protein
MSIFPGEFLVVGRRKEEASIYFGVSDYLIYDASPLRY